MKYGKKIVIMSILSLSIYADKVDVNFKNLEISDFIKMVAMITHIDISMEEEINGKINFASNRPIEKNNLLPLSKTILESKGMTLKETKNGYKVVNIKEEKETNIKAVLFQLNAKNDEIMPLLKKCKKYEYVSNKDGGFYLIVIASNDILISLKKIIIPPQPKQATPL